MAVISWSLEFIAGLVALAVNLEIHDPESNVDFITCGVIVDALLNFIIIPSSYIMNNEVMKKIIIAEGWCRSIGRHMLPKKVTPSQSENVVHQNEREANNRPTTPISTVSCSIQSLVSAESKINDSKQSKPMQ